MTSTESSKPVNWKDLTPERNEYLFKMPSILVDLVTPLLINETDIIMIHLLYNICLVIFPSTLFLFWVLPTTTPLLSHFFGFFYVLVVLSLFFQRFILMLHFASHKPLFRSRFFDFFIQYIICPFFGLPSGVYRSHHVVMHHIENNVFPYDVSSTMQYQRNNIWHFICYWMRYTFAIWFQLPYYAWKRERYSLFFHMIGWFCVYWVWMYVLSRISPIATLWVFLIPFLLSSFFLMLGNWCQHIFIDPKRYSDSYALTYNLINSPMNKLTFNDGYHIIHHLHSTLHWSELPSYFVKNKEKFEKNSSLTFEGLEYNQVGIYMFLGWYELLAKHYVHLGSPETKKSEQELVQLFKEWLVPIQPKEE